MSKSSERMLFTVAKGALVPFNDQTLQRLREKGLKIGDIVTIDLRKPRNPGFWRMAHALGTMLSENIEAFSMKDAHEVLKAIQVEAEIECDITITPIPGVGELRSKKARSLSFESMDQTTFYDVMRKMAAYIVTKYWPALTEDRVLEMAGVMVKE